MVIISLLVSLGVLSVYWGSRKAIPFLAANQQFRAINNSYRLWLSFILAGITVSLLVATLTGSVWDTSLAYLFHAATLKTGYDSWLPMQAAIEQLRKNPGMSIYRELFFEKHIKFQYPPTSLLFLDIPQRLMGLDWNVFVKAINFLCWLCLPIIGAICYFLFIRAALPTQSYSERLPVAVRIVILITSLALVGVFYPILSSFYLGQIQTPMTLLAGAALLAFQRKRYGLAGFLIGLCCGLKPQWLVILPWAIIRRRWRMAATITATLAILVSVSVYAYGFNNFRDYAEILSFLSKHGESFFPNQSVNGLVNRALMNGNNLHWVPNGFPEFNPIVYYTTLGTSIIILGLSLFWRMKQEPNNLDLSVIFLGLTIASPIAWEHHYGILLPIFAVLVPTAVQQRTFGKWTAAYLLIAFLLISQKLDQLTNLLWNSPLNFIQSYMFFGSLLVLIILFRVSYLQSRRITS